jgi:hypothetical protein
LYKRHDIHISFVCLCVKLTIQLVGLTDLMIDFKKKKKKKKILKEI